MSETEERDGGFTSQEWFAYKMRECATRSYSRANAHIEADDLMCAQLRRLGYGDGVDVFEEMDKWYA